jgi:cobyrinic acid a,c-diamide synthase
VSARGLIIAAPQSGAGKTTVTLAILTALKQRGIAVRAAKAGPDYIDPAFHAAATGSPSANLDSWAMPAALLDAVAARTANGAEIFVVEGVMGLFDGAHVPQGPRGATADLAVHFHLPVILTLDVSHQAQSAAAVVRGFATHDPSVRIAGVILNRVASERHRTMIEHAITGLGIPVFGAIPRAAELALPERHLGLVQAGEHPDLVSWLERLAATAVHHLDLDAIMACAAPLEITASTNAPALAPPGQRIALAQDQAFSFIYPHLVAAWRDNGAEIIPFSPLRDEPPSEHADCCWLPGGYPELHAETLATAQHFATGLRRFAETRRVHGECGGYMVLGQSLEDAKGRQHAMTGLLSHATSFAKRKLQLGYRSAHLIADTALGRRDTILRGHEFHYALLISNGDDEPFAELADAQGRALGHAGGRRGRVTGTFFHAIASA